MSRSIFVTLLALLLAACSELPSSVTNEDLSIRAHGGTLELTNRATEPLYFRVVVRPVDPLLDWWPCSSPEGCNGVAPGQRQEIPYSEIAEFRPEASEALLTWWFLEPVGDGYRMVRMHSQILKL